MSKTKLVVFDMAGTTVRDRGNVKQAFLQAFLQFNMEIPESDIKPVMGYRKMDAIRFLMDKFYPGKRETYPELVNQLHRAFEDNMMDHYMCDPTLAPLPDAESTFQWLHQNGIKVALNTGFTRPIADTILYRLGWKDNRLIDEVICSDEVISGRPEPYMIREIMHRLNINDSEAVVKVGDTEVDIAEGRNAHCGMVISVTTGANSREDLEHYRPDYIIDSLSELPSLIQ